MESLFKAARKAAHALHMLDAFTINKVLQAIANEVETQTAHLLAENAKDLANMEKENPLYDRLLLNQLRLKGVAADIRNVASLPNPLDKKIEQITHPNGMVISKRTVPFGVIGVIYEARPNVTFDVFSLCFKAGSASVLKGGTNAYHSNKSIVELIQSVLAQFGLDVNMITLLPPVQEATQTLLNAVGDIDLLIPRGGKGLIDYVRNNAKVPVIETGAGVCHTYFDTSGDLAKGSYIVLNAKTRRVSVCNALDCLLIHRNRLGDLATLCAPLSEKKVLIYADKEAYEALQEGYPKELLAEAKEEHFATEFMDYKMSVKTVGSTLEAIEQINRTGTKHSECIVAEEQQAQALFGKMVDAACVYTNVSTAFTDGAQFGFGAEIGISTQKMHARGPMALAEICTYKWYITGNGQTRNP